jgi:hypothetical protein
LAPLVGNIVKSDHFQHYLKFFANQGMDTDAHMRLFALMVARSLLGHLTGAHQANAAYCLLHSITSKASLDEIGNAINFEGQRVQDVGFSRVLASMLSNLLSSLPI